MQLQIDTATLKKLRRKHVGNPNEPWECIIPQRNSIEWFDWSAISPEACQLYQRFIYDAVQKEFELACQRPLYVTMRVNYRQGNRSDRDQINAVGPSGLLIIVEGRPEEKLGVLASAYFKSPPLHRLGMDLRHCLVLYLLDVYCGVDGSCYRLPLYNESFDFSESQVEDPRMVTFVQFHSPENFGFRKGSVTTRVPLTFPQWPGIDETPKEPEELPKAIRIAVSRNPRRPRNLS